MPTDNRDSHLSTLREKVLEHVFVGELTRHIWLTREHDVEVLRAETDSSGYDLVIECNGIVRHIQLKASAHSAKTRAQKINMKLGLKPAGCVV